MKVHGPYLCQLLKESILIMGFCVIKTGKSNTQCSCCVRVGLAYIISWFGFVLFIDQEVVYDLNREIYFQLAQV